MVNIHVVGITGKMGQTLKRCIEEDPDFQLVEHSADLIIDFSHPDALEKTLETALSRKCPLVIGTTGLHETHFQAMKQASSYIPLFYAPNFSLGILALSKTVKIFVDTLKNLEKIEIIDIHHKQKKDAPSGTALFLSEQIGFPVTITSLREEDVVGEHRIIFHCKDEKITLSHQAFSREVFAKGALLCAKWLTHQPPGYYEKS